MCYLCHFSGIGHALLFLPDGDIKSYLKDMSLVSFLGYFFKIFVKRRLFWSLLVCNILPVMMGFVLSYFHVAALQCYTFIWTCFSYFLLLWGKNGMEWSKPSFSVPFSKASILLLVTKVLYPFHLSLHLVPWWSFSISWYINNINQIVYNNLYTYYIESTTKNYYLSHYFDIRCTYYRCLTI